MSDSRVVVHSRVNVSMVSLKWGDVLSAVLPGAVMLLAVAPYFPFAWDLLIKIDSANLATGVALLFACALCGGLLEGLTRIGWEKYVLCKMCPSIDALSKVNPENLELYERGVQSSYKYVTFYSNLAHALMALLITYGVKSQYRHPAVFVALTVGIAVLLRASFVQWTYFVNYQTKIFGKTTDTSTERTPPDAPKRPAPGNSRDVSPSRKDRKSV